MSRTRQESPLPQLCDVWNHEITRWAAPRKRLINAISIAYGPNNRDQFLLEVRKLDAIMLSLQTALQTYCARMGEEEKITTVHEVLKPAGDKNG